MKSAVGTILKAHIAYLRHAEIHFMVIIITNILYLRVQINPLDLHY